MNAYLELKIVWNPNYQYGGSLAVEETEVDADGKRKFRHLRNGIWNRHEAFEYAETLTKNKKHWILIDDTLDVASGWIAD